MYFLAHYALFLLNTATIVIAISVVLAVIFSLASRNKLQHKGKIQIKKLNKCYQEMKHSLNQAILSKKAYKQLQKQQKQAEKKAHKTTDKRREKKRLFVLHFNGDIKASQVDCLREEITALLTVATSNDEVLICLESPGGIVHGYGLAASQLQRIRQQKIPLTIAVDKVAASGGYMMACVADKIIAAPFAIIGSIGVLVQLPNFNKLLEKNHINYEMLSAGEYKRTLTVFGKNTEKGRAKLQQEIEQTQILFKDFIAQNRPVVNLQEVATGEHWFAIKAIEYRLIDTLQTSDDYLLQASNDTDIYIVKKTMKKGLLQKLGYRVQSAVSATIKKIWREQQESRYL